jgi:hypothetical protein
MNKLTAACASLCLPLMAAAHDGHGLQGPHWHASDTVGFVALAVLAAGALWLGRGQR